MARSIFRFLTDFVEPEKQELFSLLIRYSPAAIAVFDTEMRYIAASEKWIRDYGLVKADFKGRSHYEIFPEILQKNEWVESHLRTLSGHIESSPCDRFLRSDGALQYVRWENRPWYKENGDIGGIIMFTDVITGEIEQARELERQKRFMDRAQQIANVGYWRIDLMNKTVYWSEEIYRIHGVDPATYKPELESAIDAYHPRDRNAVEEAIKTAIEKKESYDFRLRLIRPNGEIRLVRSQGECELNAEGEVIGVFGVFKDITEDRLPQSSLYSATTAAQK